MKIICLDLKSKEISWTEPNSMEKFNWLLHLQHVRGETEACKTLIKEGIATSKGKNEYVYFKEVFDFFFNLKVLNNKSF